MRSGDWKLIKYESTKDDIQETQLFNIADNPHEFLLDHHHKGVTTLTGVTPHPNQKNLADDKMHAQKRAKMEQLLLAEMRRLDDPYRLWDQPDDGLPIPVIENPLAPKKKIKRTRKTTFNPE